MKKRVIEAPAMIRHEYYLGKFGIWFCWGKENTLCHSDKLYVKVLSY